jgi:hypothetical protein
MMDIISLTEQPNANGDDKPGRVLKCRRARPRDEEHFARWPKLLELASVVGMGAFLVAATVTMGIGPVIDRLGAIETALAR